MNIGKTNAASGGMNINGIIERYKVQAGENISAGDFVEFVTTMEIRKGEDSQLSQHALDNIYPMISAVALLDGNVFIAYSGAGAEYHLYGMIVSIDGTTVTIVTDTLISNQSYAGYIIEAILLPDGNVFLAHSLGAAYYLNSTIIDARGGLITVLNSQVLTNANFSSYGANATLLPNGNVFVAHCGAGTNYQLYGMIVSIYGASITVGVDTVLSIQKVWSQGSRIKAILLPNGNIFIAYATVTNGCLYGTVISIDETRITAGASNFISNQYYTGHSISMVLLPNGNIFLAHSMGTVYYLYGMIISINGTTITAGTDTLISNQSHAAYTVNAILLSNGKVFIAHSLGTDYHLYGIGVSINGTTITIGTDTLISDQSHAGQLISSTLLSSGEIFIAHSFGTDHDLYGIVASQPDLIESYKNTIGGVAKTKGSGGDNIQVFVPVK